MNIQDDVRIGLFPVPDLKDPPPEQWPLFKANDLLN